MVTYALYRAAKIKALIKVQLQPCSIGRIQIGGEAVANRHDLTTRPEHRIGLQDSSVYTRRTRSAAVVVSRRLIGSRVCTSQCPICSAKSSEMAGGTHCRARSLQENCSPLLVSATSRSCRVCWHSQMPVMPSTTSLARCVRARLQGAVCLCQTRSGSARA